MSDQQIRFAILGCGRISSRHAEALRKIPGISLVACADVSIEQSRFFGEKYSIPYFRSLDELLSWGQFDVLCICTPSGMHASHAITAMQSGKHVVVEKPMALRLEDADRMIEDSDRHGVHLFVVKQNRYSLPIIALRRALEEGRFGRLILGTTRVRWCREQTYYNQGSWRGTWALDGGVLANQASHHIDLLEWCMGEVESVLAKTATQLVDIECEDTGLAILKFTSGALGLIEATTATRPKDLEGSLSILGERGSVEISGFAVNEIRHFNFVDSRPDDEEIKLKYSSHPPDVYGFGHLSYFQNVVSVLRKQAKPLVDGIVGRRSLKLINAIYASADSGREVFLKKDALESRLGK